MAAAQSAPASRPPSSAARNTKGLKVEAGWRRACVTKLKGRALKSVPPTMTTTRPAPLLAPLLAPLPTPLPTPLPAR